MPSVLGFLIGGLMGFVLLGTILVLLGEDIPIKNQKVSRIIAKIGYVCLVIGFACLAGWILMILPVLWNEAKSDWWVLGGPLILLGVLAAIITGLIWWFAKDDPGSKANVKTKFKPIYISYALGGISVLCGIIGVIMLLLK